MFQEIYNKILINQNIIKYEGIKIGIIAGSFRIPYQYDIALINEYLEFCDKVIIFISNVSKDKIDNKLVSNTNAEKLAILLNKIQTTNISVKKQLDKIKLSIENYSYKELKDELLKLADLIDSIQIKQKIEKYIQNIQKNLYKSIKYLNNIELTGDIIKNIFKILFNQQKLLIYVSKFNSPVLDAIDFSNNICNNCEIYIQSLNNYNDKNTTWENLYKQFSHTNKILQYYSKTKQNKTRQYILDNFNQLSDKQIFGDIQQYKINEIRNLLNGQQ